MKIKYRKKYMQMKFFSHRSSNAPIIQHTKSVMVVLDEVCEDKIELSCISDLQDGFKDVAADDLVLESAHILRGPWNPEDQEGQML